MKRQFSIPLKALAVSLIGTVVGADALYDRYAAAHQAINRQMFVVFGSDPAQGNWTAQDHQRGRCALAELEALRGRKTAEKYVSALEWGVGQSKGFTRAGEFGALASQMHRKGGVKLERDAVPITRKCGVGP